MTIGAQLYTVREFCRTPGDLSESLKKIADIGYTTVQVSGTCEYEPGWLAEELKKTGLRCAITHYSPVKIKNDPAKVAADHKLFGCRYIGLGSLPEGPRSLGEVDRFAEEFIPAAKTLRENGAYLVYHNHHFEFTHDENGVTYLERIKELFPADLLGFTLDTFWIQMGGGDPAKWIRRMSGRAPCIHLKDLTMNVGEQRMAPVGSGNLDFPEILSAAQDAGTEYLLVEQDDCYGRDPFEELTVSYKYLKAQGLS